MSNTQSNPLYRVRIVQDGPPQVVDQNDQPVPNSQVVKIEQPSQSTHTAQGKVNFVAACLHATIRVGGKVIDLVPVIK